MKKKESTTIKVSAKEKIIKVFKMLGLTFVEPFIRLFSGEGLKSQSKLFLNTLIIPLTSFVLFIGLWSLAASSLKSDLGEIPGPGKVWEQAGVLWDTHVQERDKEREFFKRQEGRIAQMKAQFPDKEIQIQDYTGKPTFIDQIFTSLETVFMGFLLGSLMALPLGIFMGLSQSIRIAINPLIQIFKPVSPVVWLLLVTMVVSAVLKTNDTFLPKSFIISFISVALCSMWPTLVNTSMGVASVDKDFINVGRVLKLNTFNKIFKIILPASMPMVFTGLRISLSISWMVLIAIELLAQNPGLGKFVWDEFQNGSTNSNAKIIVGLFVIGIIGYVLDRLMIMIQQMVTFNKENVH